MIGKLLDLITGNATAAIAVACALAGAAGAWTIQGWRMDALQARFDGFVAQTKIIGEQAQKEADAIKTADEKRKEVADHENKSTRNALLADIKRLRDSSARSGNLSSPTPSTGSPDKTCFDPAKLDLALRNLDQGILGIVESGSEAVIDLDTAKAWAASK